MALRVPITTPASPFLMRRHSSRRSPAERLECSTAMSSPKCEEKVRSICGVSAISGTSSIAVLPRRRISAMRRMYIVVLPLPVTPKSSAPEAFLPPASFRIPLKAFVCSEFSFGSGCLSPSGASGRR